MVEFCTLQPDGTVSDVRTIKQSSIAACPFVIMVPEHYRSDGTCRCDDYSHHEMYEWEYVWDSKTGKWTSREV